MRRFNFPVLPTIVAGVVFAVASPAMRAVQHDHPADAPAAQSCACCGNSSDAAMNHGSPDADVQAMNHTAAGGCCDNMTGKMAANQTSAGKSMAHDASMSCCSHMAMNHGEVAKSDTAPMNFGAVSCPSDAASNEPAADAATPGHDHATSGCCANMAADKGGGGCCAGMAKMHGSTK